MTGRANSELRVLPEILSQPENTAAAEKRVRRSSLEDISITLPTFELVTVQPQSCQPRHVLENIFRQAGQQVELEVPEHYLFLLMFL